MRPFKMTADKGLQPDMASVLYVMRDNTSSGNGLWWCVWAVPGQSIYCGAEGYCSRRMLRTRAGAIAYGKRMWHETATYWPPRAIEAPAPKAS
jgi:hypothetical protein